MDKKYRSSYYGDWWKIKRSSIYGTIALLLFLLLSAGGIWWMMRNNWFLTESVATDIPKDSARIVSFEGDVRITRALTRATEKVAKSTFLLAGDTVQTQSDGKAQIRMIDGSTFNYSPE